MDILPIISKKKKINLEEFREKYREEIDYIFNNYIMNLIEDNNLPLIDEDVLYYDIIKFFYLTSI